MRPIPAKVLHGDRMPPRDLFGSDAEESSQFLALEGARRVLAIDDGLYDFLVQAGRIDKLLHTDTLLLHTLAEGFHKCPNVITVSGLFFAE